MRVFFYWSFGWHNTEKEFFEPSFLKIRWLVLEHKMLRSLKAQSKHNTRLRLGQQSMKTLFLRHKMERLQNTLQGRPFQYPIILPFSVLRSRLFTTNKFIPVSVQIKKQIRSLKCLPSPPPSPCVFNTRRI